MDYISTDVQRESQSQELECQTQSPGVLEVTAARGGGRGGARARIAYRGGKSRGSHKQINSRTCISIDDASSEEDEGESLQNEADDEDPPSRDANGMDTSTANSQPAASSMNRAIDELLQTARELSRAGKRWRSNQFDCYLCRFCNKELGIDELEADIHIIEHFSEPEAMNSIQDFTEV